MEFLWRDGYFVTLERDNAVDAITTLDGIENTVFVKIQAPFFLYANIKVRSDCTVVESENDQAKIKIFNQKTSTLEEVSTAANSQFILEQGTSVVSCLGAQEFAITLQIKSQVEDTLRFGAAGGIQLGSSAPETEPNPNEKPSIGRRPRPKRPKREKKPVRYTFHQPETPPKIDPKEVEMIRQARESVRRSQEIIAARKAAKEKLSNPPST